MDELKELLLLSNDYISFTVNHYNDCYPKLNVEQIKTLTGLFNELKTATIKEKNIRDESRTIKQGFELKKKEKVDNELDSVKNILSIISSAIKNSQINDLKAIAFLESITKLAYACDFMNNDELYTINSLFDKILLFDYELSDPIQSDNKVFYTRINNYMQK